MSESTIDLNQEINNCKMQIKAYMSEMKQMRERSEHIVKFIHETNGKIEALTQIKARGGIDKIIIQGGEVDKKTNNSFESNHPHEDHGHHNEDCNCPPGHDCNCDEEEVDNTPIAPLNDLYSQFKVM